ncbi:MAG: LytR C-terminal domain-containing protein [Elusimicrobia bacterium]|nr:LytR C-terminal domain-containing protein [Elusimicrobiota bacterium]
MELPRAALNAQRALALVLLAAVLGVAAVESRSPFAARLRADAPWPFWLAVREPGRTSPPALHLGVFHPVRGVLVLIHVPEATRLQGKLTAARAYLDALRATGDAAAAARAVEDLAQIRFSELSLEPVRWDGAGRLSLELAPGDEEEEPAVAAARALKARGRSPRALWPLARRALDGLLKGDKAAADALLLTLELRRVPLERLQPASLPDDAAAPGFLARAFASRLEPRDEEKTVVVEVLNGTDVPGLAAQAAKVLRLSEMDAMVMGQTPRPRSRTVVYDRIGDFERAARVRAALGCPTAIAATRIDPLRGVDASVELGGDCSY